MEQLTRLFSTLLLAAAFAIGQGTPPTQNDCKESPLRAYLSQAKGTALLEAYGYDLEFPFRCRELHSPHTSAAILHFQMNMQDNNVWFTIVQIPGIETPWVIP